MLQIILVLAAVATLAWVGGQPFPYELVIQFHQYSNPNHTTSNGDCCNHSCTDDCNSTLQLCYARNGGTNQSNFSCFSLGFIGGDCVTFTDCVGDEENPVVLRANILPLGGYQLVIESESSTNGVLFSLVDRTFVSIPASALGNYSHPQNYSGEILSPSTSPVTINLSYCLRCSPNYTMCTVDNVTQCVHECECINGSASESLPMLQTVLNVTLPEELPSKCIATFPSDYTPGTTDASDPGGAFVAVIAGAGVGALVLVVLIIVLVVVGVAVFLRGRKKKSGHTASKTSNMEIHGEDSDGRQGNMHDSVKPNLNTEKAICSTENPIHLTTELPVYSVVQRYPHKKRNSTQLEMSDLVYDDIVTQRKEEPEYQEPHRYVENFWFSSTVLQNQ